LIGNALKFRGPAPPEITVTAEDAGEKCWQFTVCDNGVGIPEADLSKIFEPFVRVSAPEKPEGSGLGLAIVQKIILNHGGKIWAESKPGEGTKFHFTLPKAPTQH
jgi:signal transduction histidine kinase